MYEINSHLKRINTAAYLVITWSLFMIFMSLLVYEKSIGIIPSSYLFLGILEMIILFALAVGVTSKRFSLLWPIFIILVIDTIGILISDISGPIAILFRLIIIGFVAVGIRSAFLLKDITNFYKENPSEPISNNKFETNYYDEKHDYTSIHSERSRNDFRTDEEYYLYLLHLNKSPSIEEIKTSYKNAIKYNHPDRFEHLGDDFRKIAEARTKLINEAMEFFKRKYSFN